MQVLPSVGASIAKAQGLTSYERVLLYQPDVNVRLGMAHLDAMLRQYPRVEYALAAYNAGGAPVRRWRQKRGTDDPELFVERIPYDETRDYVRILLRNQAMYRTLLRLASLRLISVGVVTGSGMALISRSSKAESFDFQTTLTPLIAS